ncbi:MAG: hypothetical protein GYB25_13705 [Rhodobacteraceae bacterium]|nr:hypothetical protein [Paracoccaceae bacterium]
MQARAQVNKSSFHIKDSVIRVLIASYLMAASVGIAPGPDLIPLFTPFMSVTVATAFSTLVLFLLAYAMMAGIWLRITILLLAVILVGESFMENFILAESPDLGTIWQDVVVLCALIQSLIHLTNRQLRKSAIVRRSKPVRRLEAGDPLVRLRSDDLPERMHTPPVTTTPKPKPVETIQSQKPVEDDDIANIFA